VTALVAMLTVSGCGSASKPHRLTLEQFKSVRLGSHLHAVEKRLGQAQYQHHTNNETCLGWDRVGQRSVSGRPAFTACFKDGIMVSEGILDPTASD
jgi:hypothetical protein